jgi:circadian clock protein KaiC
MKKPQETSTAGQLSKVPTGMEGFDDVTAGGLPVGRITLLLGLAGSGKTVFGLEFLSRGVRQYDEPGVLISFEETEEDLVANSASLGFNLRELVSGGKLVLDHVYINPGDFIEAGKYDLSGLLARIGHAADSIGAKRVVLDAIPALFYGFKDSSAVRAALAQLYGWLKRKGLTTIVTAESETELAQHGLGRSLADCIILISERITDNIATRYLRVAKYRGSSHGTSEYPFLISHRGISVLPVTSVKPDYEVSSERITTGIPRLDTMIGGQGYYRGSSILVSGEAGTGKTSLAAQLALATCRRGERCLYFAFEESEREIVRNMRSIGLDLEPHVKSGLLDFYSSRATMYGLEMHLVTMEREVNRFDPGVVILDPVTNLLNTGTFNQVRAMVSRLIDFLKSKGITTLFTSLSGGETPESDIGVSSIMDAWIVLRNLEINGEHSRLLYVLKSRGMAHSNQVREFVLTEKGVELVDAYVGPGGILTGTARISQEARDRVEIVRQQQELKRKEREHKQKHAALEAQIASLRTEIEASDEEILQLQQEARQYEADILRQREDISRARWADTEERKQTGRRRGRKKTK